jgi:hypothetical protein
MTLFFVSDATRDAPKTQTKNQMTTTTKNYGAFQVRKKSIHTKLKSRIATLTCERQSGITPLGSKYKTRVKWWVKFDGEPCSMGPWSSKMIRTCFA